MDFRLDTGIGKRIEGRYAIIAALLAIAIVALDLIIMMQGVYTTPYRVIVLIICLMVYGKMCGWHLKSLGLVLFPAQSLRYWAGVTVFLGVIMGVVLGLGFGVAWLTGYPISIRPMPVEDIPQSFYFMCVSAPVFEEIVYRLALCVAASALLGPQWTIVVSGIVFASYHILGGVGAPDNIVAGFILGWAFLKSGSLTVPIILHALGNFCVLSVEIGMGIFTYGIAGHS